MKNGKSMIKLYIMTNQNLVCMSISQERSNKAMLLYNRQFKEHIGRQNREWDRKTVNLEQQH